MILISEDSNEIPKMMVRFRIFSWNSDDSEEFQRFWRDSYDSNKIPTRFPQDFEKILTRFYCDSEDSHEILKILMKFRRFRGIPKSLIRGDSKRFMRFRKFWWDPEDSEKIPKILIGFRRFQGIPKILMEFWRFQWFQRFR